jgi:hypothetical protein
MSDYLENTLDASSRSLVESHLNSCSACTELLASMSEVLDWSAHFQVFEAPAWLPARIIANTPARVVQETWLDTLAAVGRWLIEPRTAMGLLTTILMIGMMIGRLGTPDVGSIVRDPMSVCYNAYDEVVRTFYHAPVVTEIQTEIAELREIS